MDTEGVRNAWIEKSDDYEILMYLQQSEKASAANPVFNLTYDSKKGEELLRLRGLYKVFVDYEDNILKENRENDVADVIRKKLQFHRNVCEDFVSVSSIEYEAFSIEAIIQVSEGTDINLITAKIYKVIHDFFSPPLNFYTLEQMLEKKGSVEEVFDGPALKYGFIDSDELQKSERFKDVHLSDIIRLISGVEGVIAVKKFTFGNTSSPFSAFTEWINDVKDMQKTPRLNIENSTVTFVRSGDRHRPGDNKQSNKERVAAIFSFLQSSDFKSRLKDISKDLIVPKGEFMDVADYYPFQNNLPTIYGMDEKYIDDTLDRLTIAKAVDELLDQKAGIGLRRVLVRLFEDAGPSDGIRKTIEDFFDEPVIDASSIKELFNHLLKDKAHHAVVADTLNDLFGENSQTPLKERLNNLIQTNPYPVTISEKTKVVEMLASQTLKKSLLSITHKDEIEQLKQAYGKLQISRLDKRKRLTLQLRGFLMVFEQIMADHLSQLAHTKELFSFNPSVKQTYFPQVLEEIKDVESLFIDFKKYKESQLKMIENEQQFTKARNGMLDHLMARFSESMDKYTFFMRNFAGGTAGKKVIADKIAFLADYIPISTYRGKAFDYSSADNVWDNGNVEGFKKRICRLLGITNYHRRTIAHDSIFIKAITLDDNTIDRYVVMLTDPDNRDNILLESVQYESEGEARQILNYILEQGLETSLYIEEGRKDRWQYQIKKATQENDFEIVAESIDYQDRNKRDEAFKKTLEVLSFFSEDENFHVIEHILLRPKVGPRESISKKRSSAIDQDSVNLLSIRNVPDNIAISVQENVEELTYKFNISQHRDSKQGDITIWNVNLLEDDTEILVVKDDFTFYRHLTRRINQIREYGADVANYFIETSKDGLYIFKLKGKNVLAESRKSFRKREDIDEQVIRLVQFFSFDLNNANEPAAEDSLAYYTDPYSLQLSIVLPNWHKRFRSPAYMHMLEKTIYLETPAHIHPHIYWLDHKQMKEFEEAYRLWIGEFASSETPDTDVVNNMILALNELRK